jgi:hypothetical protein
VAKKVEKFEIGKTHGTFSRLATTTSGNNDDLDEFKDMPLWVEAAVEESDDGMDWTHVHLPPRSLVMGVIEEAIWLSR